ncbi:MAG: hypothetical protein JSU59_01420 [Nitrospirota bacterium]|nr:MAG: hypothetical protein JSU59_01420 [Nitrospirota bacterium]
MDYFYVGEDARNRNSFTVEFRNERKNEQEDALSTPSKEEGLTMLMEATIAMLVLMGITWAGAIWASYQAPRKTQHPSLMLRFPARKAA